MAGSSLQISKPMNIKEIAAKAEDFEFDPQIQLKYWLRTADSLLKEAHIYEQEDNDQQAFLLLIRYADIVTNRLPRHPAAKHPENRNGMRAIQRTLPDVMDTLEILKPKITARYDNWQRTQERRREISSHIEQGAPRPSSRTGYSYSDPAIAGNTSTIAAAEHGDYAVKLAHEEIRKRDARRRASRQAGVTEEQEQERRTAGLWDDWEAALSKSKPSADDDEIRQNMEATRRRLDGSHDMAPDMERKRRPSSRSSRPSRPVATTNRNGTSEYRYPSIAKAHSLPSNDLDVLYPPNRLPPKPPKETYEPPFVYDAPPPLPAKTATDVEPNSDKAASAPHFTFRPAAYLENGKPLRTVFLPPTLRQKFLTYAATNTRANLETCGILCGTLISNALFISRLVIPEQTATSDTCEMTNESRLFDYCESEDLLVLGWIHTHPTQTCFMSSRDLHTHFGYQIMMRESISIVCAPNKNPSWGVFRMTDPPGMPEIMSCRQTGIFHPHNEGIYTDALRPGHVFEAEGLEFSVMDMRPGR